MRIEEFKIEEAVIHVLDLNCDEPILNESYVNLLNEDINIFLTKHVEKILKDEELILGKFIGRPNFLDFAEGFLNNEVSLLEASKKISLEFFETMVEAGEDSSCDLLFLKLNTEVGNSVLVMKLDYVKNYIHKIEYIENKMQIDIVPQFITLPNSSQKVMKAFLILKDVDENLKLLYLNKIGKNQIENGNYFEKYFLRCSKENSNYSNTKDLISAAEKWTRKNIKDNADKAFLIRESLRDKLYNNENLNVNAFAREVFENDVESLEKFVDFVELSGVNGNISIDKNYVDKKYQRIRLKIDKDIDLYIDKDSFYDINRFEVKRNGDGSLTMVIKYVLNYMEK